MQRSIFVLSVFGFAGLVLAQDPLTPSDAASGAARELPGQVPVRFVLDGARYALAIDRSGPAHVPSASEKLLIVEFTLEHLDTVNRPFLINQLAISAIDADPRFGEALYRQTTDARLIGTDRPAGRTLLNGQTRKIYQGIFVDAASSIDELLIKTQGGEATRLSVAGRIDPLPAELAGREGELPEMIPAEFSRRYVLGAYDLAVQGVERRGSLEGRTTEEIIVSLEMHNRLEDDWKLDKGWLPAYVTDADGERHQLADLWKADDDETAKLQLAPGQTVGVRLRFVVPQDFNPSELALFSRSSRGRSHRLMFDLERAGGDVASGSVLGKYDPADTGSGPTASGGSSGLVIMPPPTRIYDPTDSTRETASETDASLGTTTATEPAFGGVTTVSDVDFAETARRREAEIFGERATTSPGPSDSGLGTGIAGTGYTDPSPLSPEMAEKLAEARPGSTRFLEEYEVGREEHAANAAAEEAAQAEAEAQTEPQRLPWPVRHAVFDLQKLRIAKQYEKRGDEYYLVTYPFRGVLGTGDRIHTFDPVRQIRSILPGEDWAELGDEFQIPGDVGQLGFPNLKPYEVYGFVAIVMEADGNSDAQRAAAFGFGEFQNEDGALEVLADLFNRAVPRLAERPAYEERTCEVVTAVDRLVREGIGIQFDHDATLTAIADAIALPLDRKGFGVFTPTPDTISGWFGGFWINLPGGETCFPEGHEPPTSLFPAPGPLSYDLWEVSITGEHRLYE